MAKNVNVQVSVNKAEEVSYSVVLKGLREVGKQAKSLGQTLKTFDGILGETVEVTLPKGGVRSFTIGELLSYCGCKCSANKKGKVSVSAFRGAVAPLITDGKIQMYRNVPGHVFAEAEKGQGTRVYTYDKEKNEWKTVSKFMLVECEDGKWTVDVVLRLLLQAKYVEKFQKRTAKSEEEWAAVKTIYTFDKAVNKGGETNKAKTANKELVSFGK